MRLILAAEKKLGLMTGSDSSRNRHFEHREAPGSDPGNEVEEGKEDEEGNVLCRGAHWGLPSTAIP